MGAAAGASIGVIVPTTPRRRTFTAASLSVTDTNPVLAAGSSIMLRKKMKSDRCVEREIEL